MNTIANLLIPEGIGLDVKVADKAQLLDEIGKHMERRHGLSRDWVVAGLSRREQAGSTA
ncbi:PTS sugar transporter subunit IIA [Aromatoleum diolicum]|uniref:PTS sugar transporter subunit IIA n=1 Tax=Aromatoleum diolicum TaxID=75796 RepID=UPI001B7D202D|nr:PTS sugar transporter subunit IIA [Aromatoleum diolicum]